MVRHSHALELILVLAHWRDVRLNALALASGKHELVRLRIRLERVRRKRLPVIEDRLRERLARCRCAQIGGESKGLKDGQVRLDVVNGRSWPLLLVEDNTPLLVDNGVDAAKDGLR